MYQATLNWITGQISFSSAIKEMNGAIDKIGIKLLVSKEIFNTLDILILIIVLWLYEGNSLFLQTTY